MCVANRQNVLNRIFDQLLERSDEDGHTNVEERELDQWSISLGADWLEALDLIGAEVARRYSSGEVNYAFGDSLANDLYGELIDRVGTIPDDRWPNLFDEVYLAFDAGEWRRTEDGDADPVKLYTDPAIAEIVAKYC